MTNPIVSVNVSVLKAPAPPTLQKTGAIVSQGGTITSPGTKSLLTQLADLTPLLTPAEAISSITWSASPNIATAITVAPHGFTIGDTVPLTIAGGTQPGYDGTFLCTIIGVASFTYPLASNPGTETLAGTYVPAEVASVTERATTFFAQGSGQSVYVLELGPGDAADGVTFLTAWIAANPNFFYSYLVSRSWDANASFLAMLGDFNATTAKTYFFVTTTLQNWQLYANTPKCVVLMIECPSYGVWPANALTALSQTSGTATATTTTNHGVVPGDYFQLAGNLPAAYNGWFLALPGTATDVLVFNVPSATGAQTQIGTLVESQYASAGVSSTEFSLAAVFWVTLNYRPTSTNKVTPLNLSYLIGVTPFPTEGNAALLSTLNAGNVNFVGTGAAGGSSADILIGGNTLDGNPFNYWYSIDWTQINLAVNTTAALIAAANNPQNPIYYNQPGINSLQTVAVKTMNTGITNGLVLNNVKMTTLDAADFVAALDAGTYDGYTVVNADPFVSYVEENPDDYAIGTYDGLSIEYTPLIGFESITINVTVSSFAT
jgi:hypothetical protein